MNVNAIVPFLERENNKFYHVMIDNLSDRIFQKYQISILCGHYDVTVYKILRKSMIYVCFISCFDEPVLFRLLLQRSSTVGFSTSVNSVVRLPTNILFPSINMLIAAFKSLS